MENLNEVKNLILQAKNITIIPSQEKEIESIASALALFYTLKELQKNVNLIIDEIPEKIKFLTPISDFISTPQNFVISIPKNIADVSQIYYEKNEDSLKIHLTTEKGNLKKDNISFYYTQAKPDLLITLGIKDFRKELENKLDSFGFLLGSPILNIDHQTIHNATEIVDKSMKNQNLNFGKINLVKEDSISEIIYEIILNLKKNPIDKNEAACLLTGLLIHYKNFGSEKTKSKTFKISSELMERGADYHLILKNIKNLPAIL